MGNNRNKVYGFSNENLTSYLSLYHFDNARVLSVIGSGDQYFTSILGGAKEVDLYDINYNTWDYFIFKYTAIKVLSYEEFISFFIYHKASNPFICRKILMNVPNDVQSRLNTLLDGQSIDTIFIDKFRDYQNCTWSIPYLKRDAYYKLQSLLRERRINEVYFGSITDLYEILKTQKYDVMLASNIYQWLNLSEVEYYNLMLEYNAKEIQANYTFAINDSIYSVTDRRLLGAGFTIDYVTSANNITRQDGVYSLVRK